MRAAVFRKSGGDVLEVRDDVEVVGPGPGEVLVEIKATGVCHSDLSALDGTIPSPKLMVPGHEGAGEVVEVGEGVVSVAPGDHVIIAWIPPCGGCRPCVRGQPNLCEVLAVQAFTHPRFLVDGEPAHGMAGCGTFAERLVLPHQAVGKIADDVPWEVASLIGCAVMTGVGAAINTARVEPGSSVVVFGCGGVGISVVQGARVAGAAEIVAVDPVASKAQAAKRFGATHAATPDQLGAVRDEVTGGEGFDYAFEAVGRPETIRAAYDAARRGGAAIIVGVGRADEVVEFNAFELFYMEKRLHGTIYGSADVRRDYDRLLRLWKAGRLDLEGMVTSRLRLDDVNDALEQLRGGEAIRQVILFD